MGVDNQIQINKDPKEGWQTRDQRRVKFSNGMRPIKGTKYTCKYDINLHNSKF